MDILNGKKTWLAAAGMVCLGVVSITEGDIETGIQQIVAAFGLVGIGHKIDKAEK